MENTNLQLVHTSAKQTSDIVIDKEIPHRSESFKQKSAFPVGEMEVGDNFFFEEYKYHRLSGFVNYYRKTYGRKFSRKKSIENNVIGYRIWRIE